MVMDAMETRDCIACSKTRRLVDFEKTGNGENRRRKCKYCRHQETYDRVALNRAGANRTRRAAVAKKMLWLKDLKESQPCTDCGVYYPYHMMDFDHLADKDKGIAKMISQNYSIENIAAEIAKCELVCALCHRERTHQRRVALLRP